MDEVHSPVIQEKQMFFLTMSGANMIFAELSQEAMRTFLWFAMGAGLLQVIASYYGDRGH